MVEFTPTKFLHVLYQFDILYKNQAATFLAILDSFLLSVDYQMGSNMGGCEGQRRQDGGFKF